MSNLTEKCSICSNFCHGEHLCIPEYPKGHLSDITYMAVAFIQASLSKAERAKVGACIVKDGIIVSTGYNGTPRHTDNCCETDDNRTKEEVIHAEVNAALNLLISNNGSSLKDSTIYVTYMPCIKCASVLKQLNVARVVYAMDYRLTDGIEYLKDNGVIVDKIEPEQVKAFLRLLSVDDGTCSGPHTDAPHNIIKSIIA